jgi:CDP-diglyceride synthetase
MEGEMNELTKRILTASVLAPFVLFLILKYQIGFLILTVIGSLIVGYEFAKLSKMKPLLLWLVMAFISIIFYSLLYINPHLMVYFLLLLFLSMAFWLKNLFLVFNYPNSKPKNTEFGKVVNLFLLITPLIFLPILQTQNVAMILLLLFIVWGADSFAYLSF